MAYDFPSAPTIGQLYPPAPPAGAPQYRWDGQAWVAASASGPTGGLPSGTVMVFYQPAAPVGWTKLTTQDDKALRVVAGAGGGSGGSNNFSAVMAQSVVGNHTLTADEVPNIASTTGLKQITVFPNGSNVSYVPYSSSSWGGAQFTSSGAGPLIPTSATSIGYTATFQGNNTLVSNSTNTGGNAHNHPITMDIKYVDVILASKN